MYLTYLDHTSENVWPKGKSIWSYLSSLSLDAEKWWASIFDSDIMLRTTIILYQGKQSYHCRHHLQKTTHALVNLSFSSASGKEKALGKNGEYLWSGSSFIFGNILFDFRYRFSTTDYITCMSERQSIRTARPTKCIYYIYCCTNQYAVNYFDLIFTKWFHVQI